MLIMRSLRFMFSFLGYTTIQVILEYIVEKAQTFMFSIRGFNLTTFPTLL